MSGTAYPVLMFLGTVLSVSVIAGVGAALIFAAPGLTETLGQTRSTAFGLIACALAAFALFLLADPDPVTLPETVMDYLRRTVVTTGFAAVFWLPVFLLARGRLARRRA